MNEYLRSALLVVLSIFWIEAHVHAQTSPATPALRVGLHPLISLNSETQVASAHQDSLFGQCLVQMEAILGEGFRRIDSLELLEIAGAALPTQIARALDAVHPGYVQRLCTDLALQKIVLPIVEVSTSADENLQCWRLMLRWLDARSGEMTKSLVHELNLDLSMPEKLREGFQAEAIARELLAAPDIVLPPDPSNVSLPSLEDFTLPPRIERDRNRSWIWYVSGAAVLGAGSAYLLLGRDAKKDDPLSLPEPPGPPTP